VRGDHCLEKGEDGCKEANHLEEVSKQVELENQSNLCQTYRNSRDELDSIGGYTCWESWVRGISIQGQVQGNAVARGSGYYRHL
jgi:hypothetical protein